MGSTFHSVRLGSLVETRVRWETFNLILVSQMGFVSLHHGIRCDNECLNITLIFSDFTLIFWTYLLNYIFIVVILIHTFKQFDRTEVLYVVWILISSGEGEPHLKNFITKWFVLITIFKIYVKFTDSRLGIHSFSQLFSWGVC